MLKEWYSKEDLSELDSLLKDFGLSVNHEDFGEFDFLEKHLGEFYDKIYNDVLDNSVVKEFNTLELVDFKLSESAIKLKLLERLYWYELKEIPTKIEGCICAGFFHRQYGVPALRELQFVMTKECKLYNYTPTDAFLKRFKLPAGEFTFHRNFGDNGKCLWVFFFDEEAFRVNGNDIVNYYTAELKQKIKLV